MSSEQRAIFIANQETPDKPIVIVNINDTVSIGRDPATCVIVLPAEETTISRTHCSISYKLRSSGEPSLLLTDKSSFGTNVNGKAMQKRGQRTLKVGDSISVGQQHRFVVGAVTLPPPTSRKRVLSQRNSAEEASADSCTGAVAAGADGGDVTAVNREPIVVAQEGVGAKRPKLEPVSQQESASSPAAMIVDDDGADGAWLSSGAFQRPDLSQSQNGAIAVEVKEEQEAMDSYPQASQNWTIEDDVGVGRRLQEAFEFVDLVKKDSKTERPSQIGTNDSACTVNYKKFKKASQGACARPDVLPAIVGMSDMVDFRSLPQPSRLLDACL